MKGHSILALALFTSLALLGGCKTQEQIRREQLIDSMAHQVGQGQKLTAESTTRLQNLESRVALLSGDFEELRHESGSVWKEELNKLRSELRAMDEANQARDKEIEEVKTAMQEQRKYLDQVVASLSQLSAADKKSAKSSPASEGKSGKKLSDYERAMSDFDQSNFQDARPAMIKLLDGKKVNGNKRAKILHNLGMIEYLDKNYDGATVYFSRLFTEHPGSSLNASGLFHLGLAFKNLKKNDEAKQTLTELLGRYPKSKHASDAKGVLKKM